MNVDNLDKKIIYNKLTEKYNDSFTSLNEAIKSSIVEDIRNTVIDSMFENLYNAVTTTNNTEQFNKCSLEEIAKSLKTHTIIVKDEYTKKELEKYPESFRLDVKVSSLIPNNQSFIFNNKDMGIKLNYDFMEVE